MNEILFNILFDRPIDNPDFLRGRVASCIKFISDDISKNIAGNYNTAFYKATKKYNEILINQFGLDFLSSTLDELVGFKNFLFKLFSSEELDLILKKNDYTKFLFNFHELVKNIGYVRRSRILRRYNNFIKISNNFLNGKLQLEEYKKEILKHIFFFDEMLQKLKKVNPEDVCIYYFVYDIRASENVRKLRNQIKKISID